MSRMRARARRAAVGQVVGGKKIGFGGIVENIVAGVDAGMEMRVDKSGRDQTAFGIDLLVHRSWVIGPDELDAVSVENHHAVFDDLMRLTIEADHPAALDQCFHCAPFKCVRLSEDSLTPEFL